MSEKPPGAISIPNEDAPKNPDRRRFLKKAVRNAVALGALSTVPYLIDTDSEPEESNSIEEHEKKSVEVEKIVEEIKRDDAREKIVETLSPLEQLDAFGEVKDLQAGVDTVYADHYEHLTTSGKGKNDMRVAVKNLSKLNMQKIAKPFEERNLPKELSYMIAIQETRGKKKISHAGARGITGIMPKTAKALGFKTKDADDPYKASEMTAEYLAIERDDRFGDDTDLLFHAYNAGGGLFGYTKTERKKEDRSAEGFYSYMEEYINTTYKEVKEHGYRHTVDVKDTNLVQLSRRFKVPLVRILKANNLEIDSELHEGDTVVIPFVDMHHAAKVVFRKPFEALRYAPQLKAKYQALKDSGLLATLEKKM